MPPAPHSIAGSLKRGEVLPILAILLLFGLPLFIGLGGPDMGNDEAIYSFAVQHMVQGGGWLTPESIYSPLDPQPFVEKPPLKMWLTAAGISSGLLPDNEFGLRFFDALFGVFCLLYIFRLCDRLGGPPSGLVAALLFFTLRETVFIHGFRSNNMDSLLMLCFAGAIFHFLQWSTARTARSRCLNMIAVMGFFTAGFMSKFVAVLFLPLVLGLALFTTPSWRQRLWMNRRAWFIGVLGSLVLIAPWFIYQQLEIGSRFWSIILEEQVIRRVTTSLDPAHIRPWYSYILDLGRSFLRSGGLLLVIPGTLYFAFRAWKEKWPEGRLVLLWAFLPLALISTFTAKLSHYIYPYLIPFALMGGVFLPALVRRAAADVRLRWILSGLGLLMAAIVLIRGPGYMDGVQPLSGGWLGPTLALAAAGIIAILRPRLEVLLGLLLLSGPIISWGSHMERILGRAQAPLRSLSLCLQARGDADPRNLADILKPKDTTLLHSWAFYGNLALPEATNFSSISARLNSDQSRPIWMSPGDFEEFSSRELIPAGCRVLSVPGIGFDRESPAILILPARFADCAEALPASGAVPLRASRRRTLKNN